MFCRYFDETIDEGRIEQQQTWARVHVTAIVLIKKNIRFLIASLYQPFIYVILVMVWVRYVYLFLMYIYIGTCFLYHLALYIMIFD